MSFSWDEAVAYALTLPGAGISTSDGLLAVKVNGRDQSRPRLERQPPALAGEAVAASRSALSGPGARPAGVGRSIRGTMLIRVPSLVFRNHAA